MQTWFITGASSGIGKTLTQRLLARGDRVAATLRNTDALAEERERFPTSLWVERLDVTDGREIHRVVDKAYADLGRVDVVVNNAGYASFGAAEEYDEAQIRRLLDTNLVGSIEIIRAALPHLRAQGGGRILQISSEGGQIAYPCFSVYHASKWGIEGFVESVSQEVAPFGISFTLVEPGPTRTSFGANLQFTRASNEYDGTPVAELRQAMRSGTFPIRGDLDRTVAAILEVANASPAPKRLALGSTTFESVRAALRERLALLESQREVAFAADAD